MPRPRKEIDATQEYLGAEGTRTIGEFGSETEIIDRPINQSKVELEAFMNEPVTIMVMSSGDENETDLIQVGVNGVTQFFRRDTPQTVKRKFVARLARAKKTDFRQTLDDRLGEKMNNFTRHHSLKYPFSVIEDKNPKGSAWLTSILAQAQ
jgi:hypothetical protein